MTCFQGSFRRALFFLEKFQNRGVPTFRSTVDDIQNRPTGLSRSD
jgi:hypothetical protein